MLLCGPAFRSFLDFLFLPVKVLMKRILFTILLERAFKMIKNGVYVYCDSTLGCQVIHDFDLCKLDNL